ncbi:MAG: hypothetical protein AAB592_05705 [Patescibacteria group bacterium]
MRNSISTASAFVAAIGLAAPACAPNNHVTVRPQAYESSSEGLFEPANRMTVNNLRHCSAMEIWTALSFVRLRDGGTLHDDIEKESAGCKPGERLSVLFLYSTACMGNSDISTGSFGVELFADGRGDTPTIITDDDCDVDSLARHNEVLLARAFSRNLQLSRYRDKYRDECVEGGGSGIVESSDHSSRCDKTDTNGDGGHRPYRRLGRTAVAFGR